MITASNELQKLRSMAEKSLTKTAELQQVLAQIEANLSRAETQKVIQKTNKIQKENQIYYEHPFITFLLINMTCNCKHCLEIKQQLERAERRQLDLHKERNYKLLIRQNYYGL